MAVPTENPLSHGSKAEGALPSADSVGGSGPSSGRSLTGNVGESSSSITKPDITGRPQIEQLVNAFYQRVRADEMLSLIFDGVAHTDWVAHLPKMYAFWETVLFRTGGYTGNPLSVHAELVKQTPMGRAQFDRWLLLFRETVDELFSGGKADHIKNCAEDMANVIHARINGVHAARFTPASLLPDPPATDARPQAKDKPRER